MTREEILGMESGGELDALVAEIMEPKPIAEKTYRQLEAEDAAKPSGGNYGCWEITSPEGWWEIRIDLGAVYKDELDEIPEWQSAKEASEDIATAFEVVEKMPEVTLQRHIKNKTWSCRIRECSNDGDLTILEEVCGQQSAPLVICKAALLATLEASHDQPTL